MQMKNVRIGVKQQSLNHSLLDIYIYIYTSEN